MGNTNHCPPCTGTGKQKINFSEFGKPGSEVIEIDCIYCKGGKNPMTERDAIEFKLRKEEQAKLWCKCKKSSGASYVPDGQSEVCDKHHYTCNDCVKIVQVG